jgi:hypothetical protein
MPQSRVSSAGVVKALDVLEDRYPDALAARPRMAVDEFSL